MVVCRKQRVVCGIPVFVIGTMEDGAELVRVFAQHRVEPAAELGREHLAPVMLAHRRDLVGIKNSALKEIDPAEKFDAMEREETLRQIGQAKVESPEAALLGQVMNREQGTKGQMMGVQETGPQRRPQMLTRRARGRGGYPARQFHRRSAEKNEAGGIVFV